MRKAIVLSWLMLVFTGIGILFWYNEWIYNLPTPVPQNYSAVACGKSIDISKWINNTHQKPVFLHFFNPNCPCSRFNMPHFKSLVKQYGTDVDFAIVVMSPHQYSVADIQRKFQLDLPVYFDSAIAASCGVYSTPQAVLLSAGSQLYYRGNYNKSRYCTDEKSFYAKQALDSLLQKKSLPVFSAAALKAYGCQLPTCNKNEN